MGYELGIIGAGNMAEAIARGLLRSGQLKADQIIAADLSPQRRELFTEILHIKAVEENQTAGKDARVVLLSVKPQQMAAALAGLGVAMQPDTLVLSIAAAVSTGYIEKSLGAGRDWRVVRSMPNTPMLVGEGLVAICGGAHATTGDLTKARRIFESAAVVIETTEDKMDAVTALSGSGPAYFFYLVEQMEKAAVDLGMAAAEAHLLATRTALGAAKMLLESTDTPAELRRKVTSPGGTTQAAITHMDAHGWPAATVDAVKAAGLRSKELSL